MLIADSLPDMRGGADVAAHASSLVEKLAIPNETVKAWVAERAAWTGVAAVEVIDGLRAASRDPEGPYLLAGRSKGKPLNNLAKPWKRICERAGLSGVRLHDLRHTAASVAVGRGVNLPVIGRLLGHRQAQTTMRYAHVDTDPALAAANEIGDAIGTALGCEVISDK